MPRETLRLVDTDHHHFLLFPPKKTTQTEAQIINSNSTTKSYLSDRYVQSHSTPKLIRASYKLPFSKSHFSPQNLRLFPRSSFLKPSS
ncbi:hypothetical protein PNOK_0659800 [Pyrrhoderma noxium]|uniref:Uncharacterized protein n=1 Tax=Pyrrhoderma noxium TaxID=2282107 RepID=A0A286UER1_9AGAM|nr:hypothetical protein PNOK_0659800 [Pyrrhoderma noxium]